MAAEDYINFEDDPFFPNARHDEVANLLRRSRNRRQANVVWTTGRGDKLLLEEMDDSHIRNTIAYIKRKTEEWKKTRQQILNERGRDLGEYSINSMSGEAWITVLLAELDRRGLANVQ